MKNFNLVLVSVIIACCFVGQVQAAIVDFSDVGGLSTFQDVATGRVWLDLDNFSNKTTTEMITAATSAGFVYANGNDVSQLLNILPLNGGQWESYAAIMGSLPNNGKGNGPEDIIFGGYEANPGDSFVSWAYAFETDTVWNVFPGGPGLDVAENPGWNLWAFKEGGNDSNAVPEPATLLLFSTGLAGAFLRKKFV